MAIDALLDFVTVLFAGLLAGAEFAIHYGLRAPAATLDERSQLALRQAMVRRLRVLVPALFVPAAVSGVAAAILHGTSAGLAFRLAGLLALLVWVAVRVIATVPINSVTLDWPIDAPPTDWQAQVARAERFHDIGVFAAVIAFAAFVVPLVKPLSG